MSTRRPRIKAAANLALASKRKPKTTAESSEKPKISPTVSKVEPVEEKADALALSQSDANTISEPVTETPSENIPETQLELVSPSPSDTTLLEPVSVTPTETASVTPSEPPVTPSEPESQTPSVRVPKSPSEFVSVKPSESESLSPPESVPISSPEIWIPSENVSATSSKPVTATASEPVLDISLKLESKTRLEPIALNSPGHVIVISSESVTLAEDGLVVQTPNEFVANIHKRLKSEPSVKIDADISNDFMQNTQKNAVPYESIDSMYSPEVQEAPRKTLQSFEDAFKYPLNPDYKRPSAVVPIEENTASDFEDNILHMDLQKSPGFPMSPTKSRQRIRPTPIFGQRRNSFVGTSPSPHTEDEVTGTTRQRSSNSTSSDVSGSFLMRKLAAGNLGRIRTESGCSTVSESRGSSRKNHNDEQRNTTKREYQMRFNGGVPDKSSLKMFDLLYYNPTTNPMEKKPASGTTPAADTPETVTETNPKPQYATDSAMPVPQLKLGSNGEMMIDEMSLEIETTAEVEARKVLANSSLIYHDENSSGEGFYKKSRRTKDWLPEETIKFYRCLQTVGTDFSLMLTLFPNRTRRDLKLKFKKEERCNLNLINKALLYPGTFNIEDLQKQLDEEDKVRQEQEAKWKEIKANEAKKRKKQTNNKTSVSSRVLTAGEEVYQNENVTKAKLSKRAARKKPTTEKKPKRQRKTAPQPPSPELIDENSVLEHELTDILDIVSDVDTMDSMGENEASINLILSELANGTLAFVTSEDLTNPNKTTVNEIYIMCKETKQLSDKPLDLPEEIVDAIRAAITS